MVFLHLTHLVHFKQTGVCFPCWSRPFAQVWTQSSETNWIKTNFLRWSWSASKQTLVWFEPTTENICSFGHHEVSLGFMVKLRPSVLLMLHALKSQQSHCFMLRSTDAIACCGSGHADLPALSCQRNCNKYISSIGMMLFYRFLQYSAIRVTRSTYSNLKVYFKGSEQWSELKKQH